MGGVMQQSCIRMGEKVTPSPHRSTVVAGGLLSHNRGKGKAFLSYIGHTPKARKVELA